MAPYTVGFTKTAPAANSAAVDLRAGASERLRIREIGIFNSTAVASSLGLIREATMGTASTTVAGQPEDPGDATATGLVGTAWSAAPTIGATYLRKIILPNVIGAGLIWSWPPGEELIIPVSAGLVIWNFGAAAAAALEGYIQWDE